MHEVYKTTTKQNSTGLLKMIPQNFQQEKLLDLTKMNLKKKKKKRENMCLEITHHSIPHGS